MDILLWIALGLVLLLISIWVERDENSRAKNEREDAWWQAIK